jgi:hypothetical protein
MRRRVLKAGWAALASLGVLLAFSPTSPVQAYQFHGGGFARGGVAHGGFVRGGFPHGAFIRGPYGGYHGFRPGYGYGYGHGYGRPWRGRGWYGGGWYGGGWYGAGWVLPGVGLGYYGPGYYDDSACWVYRDVWGPYGAYLGRRLVNICE